MKTDHRHSLGLALGFAIALAGTASAQVKFGMAGPITGPSAATGAQMKNGVEQAVDDINAAGGILGQKITVEYRRRRLRSQAGRLGRQQVRRRRRQIRDRPLQLRRHHPVVRSLSGKRHPGDHAGLHQPEGHRTQHVEHLPHLRPRRSAGRGRRRLYPQALQGQEDRRRPRQDDLRQGPRRRNQEGDQQRRHEGSALRRHQHRREGLFGAGLQDQAVGRRSGLLRRPATPKAA